MDEAGVSKNQDREESATIGNFGRRATFVYGCDHEPLNAYGARLKRHFGALGLGEAGHVDRGALNLGIEGSRGHVLDALVEHVPHGHPGHHGDRNHESNSSDSHRNHRASFCLGLLPQTAEPKSTAP